MRTFKDLTNWYFSRRSLPYWCILLLDCFFVLFAGTLSYVLNHGATATANVFTSLIWTIGIFLICFVIGFRIFHTYDGVIRFSSFSDLWRISTAVIVAIVLIFIVQEIFAGTNMLLFTTVDVVLLGLFSVVMMWIMRIWVKTTYEEALRGESKHENAFILGVKSGGVALAKNIRSSSDSPYIVAGFVTAAADIENRRLMGIKVYPFNEKLSQTMRSHNAKTLIVSPLMMDIFRDHSDIIDGLVEDGIRIMVMPHAREWNGKSDLSVFDLRPINVEELLPREKIEVDMMAAADLLSNHVVLITGV